MQEERRKEPRCLIDTPLFCSLLNESGINITCIINDISLHGAMLIIPPEDQELLPIGHHVTFIEIPEQFETTLMNMQATVAWRKEKICGLHFADALPLSEEGLIAIITSIENNMGAGLALYKEDENTVIDFNKEKKF